MVFCTYEYIGLMYYTDGNDGKSLTLRFIKINEKVNNMYTNLEQSLTQTINDQDFETYPSLNDFYKIDASRFIFAATTGFTKLYIYLIQQINWYKYVKIKKYDYYLPSETKNYKFDKEFSFGLYKGFLIFTSTIYDNTNQEHFSYLVLVMLTEQISQQM